MKKILICLLALFLVPGLCFASSVTLTGGTLTGGDMIRFLPANISSCVLWLDGDDSSTITLEGSDVSQWNDKSGNSNNAAQATAAKRPLYVLNGLNNKGVLRFDNYEVVSNGNSSEIYINSILCASGNAGSNGMTKGIRIGTSGTSGGSVKALNGDIAEVIISETVMSDFDRGLIENYLNDKWDIY